MGGLSRFQVIVTAILLGGYAYLGATLAGRDALGWGGLALPFLAILWLPLVFWRGNRKTETRAVKLMVEVSYASVGYVSLLTSVALLRDAMRLLPLPTVPSLAVPAVAAALFLAGVWQARRTPLVRRIDVPIAGLAAPLQGFTIAQISDLHVGNAIGARYVDRVVRIVEGLRADVIAITGDLADGPPERLQESIAPLRRLAGPVYYVTGNHEYYWGADRWLRQIAQLGFTALCNSHVVLRRESASLVLAGVNDYIARFYPGCPGGDVAAAFAGAPDQATRVLLAHQPRFLHDAIAQRVDLQLSGHTHGGQFLPWVFLVKSFNPVVRGLKRFGKTWVYVNPGTGYWGPPLRLGTRAEITVLRLTA